MDAFERSLTQFSIALHRVVAASPGNVVSSPYSVATALGMASTGARGRTAAELCAVLGVPDTAAIAALLQKSDRLLDAAAPDSDAGVSIALASALWIQHGFVINSDFRRAVSDGFGAELRNADFGADPVGSAAAINRWVADRTRGKITELIDSSMLDEFSRLVLVNAAYFRGSWQQPFLGPTETEPFVRSDGNVVQVAMMHQQVDGAGYQRSGDWQAVRLPFRGRRMAMALLLPEPGNPLSRVLESFSADDLIGLLGGFDPEPLDLAVPRWTFRTHQNLNDSLQQLGVVTAFDTGAADFGGIADEPLVITDVVHEAFIAVDEQGAEAAAATGVAVAARAAVMPQRRRPVIFDRPFLFVIFEQGARIPLFIGQIDDPSV